MVYSIYYFVLIFFIVLGIIDLLKAFVIWSHLPKKQFYEKEKIFLIPLKKPRKDIEYIIRSIISDQFFYPFRCKITIICLDFGTDAETRKICQLLSRDFNFVKLITAKSEIRHSD